MMPAPHHSSFYGLDALPATQPTVLKHWRQLSAPQISRESTGANCSTSGEHCSTILQRLPVISKLHEALNCSKTPFICHISFLLAGLPACQTASIAYTPGRFFGLSPQSMYVGGCVYMYMYVIAQPIKESEICWTPSYFAPLVKFPFKNTQYLIPVIKLSNCKLH